MEAGPAGVWATESTPSFSAIPLHTQATQYGQLGQVKFMSSRAAWIRASPEVSARCPAGQKGSTGA